jgi:hypothetical protein
MATAERSKPLLLESHVLIIALTLDLQRLLFFMAFVSLNYSSTKRTRQYIPARTVASSLGMALKSRLPLDAKGWFELCI